MGADTKQIVRDWNREIEAEIRSEARHDEGRWKIVVWAALELFWLVAIFAVLSLFSRVPW